MKNIFHRLLYNRVTAALANSYLETRLKSLESYIFVATTGRSGTLTLVDIFNQLEGCVALHEPYPAMHDDILEAAGKGNSQLVEQYYKIRKSVNIRRAAVGARYYLEANHLFIKTFIQFAVNDFGDKIKIIHLIRNPIKVANSIYALEDQPGTIEGNRWWMDYHAPTNLIPIADILDLDPDFQHPYYKALWYWFETEARIAMWKKKLPNTKFSQFRTESFNDEALLADLFLQLELTTPPDFVHAVVNIKSHTRDEQKKLSPLPDKETKYMLDKFLNLLQDKGLSAPDTLNEYL